MSPRYIDTPKYQREGVVMWMDLDLHTRAKDVLRRIARGVEGEKMG